MASRSDTELLTEHFGYAPVSLLDEIINSVNFLAERALHSIEQGLLNAPPASLGFRPSTSSKAKQSKAKKNVNNKSGRSQLPDDEEEQQEQEEEDGEEAAARRHRDEIESGTHQLETLLWASIDKNFDVFEIYVMRNILCLRPNEMEWLRLRHYEGLDFGWVEKEKSRGGVKGNGTAAQGEAAKAVNGDGAEKEEEEDELVWSLAKELEEVDISSPEPSADDPTASAGQNNNSPPQWTVGSVNLLRRRLQASQRLHAMLVAERARTAALLNEVRRLVGPLPGTVGIKPEQPTPTSPSPSSNNQQQQQQQQTQQPPLSFLHNKGDLTASDASTPLTTTTAFSLSQLQALRDLSTTLRSFMPRLQNITTTASDDDDEDDEYDSESGKKTKSWRRQRLEYVESATRRYLENVRAGGGDDDGAEGEWLATTGGKRAVARVEVEGLETVVGLLGASVGGNNGKDNNQSNRNNGGGAHGTGAEEGDRMDES